MATADDVVTPLNDAREYRVITLPNEMMVLLCSDPTITAPRLPTRNSFAGCCGAAGAAAPDDEEDEAAEDGTKNAACAVALGVGFHSDPDNLQGCAHFVEHMLFMGTKPFPKENSWSAFLASHGGNNNAETWSERTVFYFDVHPDFLEPAMRRFGTFFSAPLFSWSGSKREARAVNSEFELANQDDTWRENQLVSHLAEEGHPYRRFGCGNQTSLEQQPKENGVDVRSVLLDFHSKYYSANLMACVTIGKEPLDTLEAWVRQSFGPAPNLSIERPSIAPNGPDGLPMSAAALPFVCKAHPLEQSRLVSLCWFLPPQISKRHERTRAGDLLGHLIGHEGKGSITAYLKKRQLISYLMAGFDDGDSTSAGALMKVVVELTKEGVEQMELVIQSVCCYIGMLAAQPGGAPPNWLWQEMRDVGAMQFRFAEEEPPMSYARRLSMCMLRKPEHRQILAADFVSEEYFCDLVADALSYMTPQRLFVMVMIRDDEEEKEAAADGKEGAEKDKDKDEGAGAEQQAAVAEAAPQIGAVAFKPGGRRPRQVGGCACALRGGGGIKCQEHPSKPLTAEQAAELPDVEPWYGTKYRREAVDPQRLAEWQSAYDEGKASTDPLQCLPTDGLAGYFHLPEPNEFIPTDFTLRNNDKSSGSGDAEAEAAAAAATTVRSPPLLVHNHADGCLFYKPDTRFKTPKACLYVRLRCLGRTSEGLTAELQVLSHMAVAITLETLNEASYAATVAGLDYSLEKTWSGYEISAAGFSHKLPKLMVRVCEALASVAASPIDPDLFERVRQRMQTELHNAGHLASSRAGSAYLECLQLPNSTDAQKLAAVTAATPIQLSTFLRAELSPSSPLHLTAFALGNVSLDEANAFYDAALAALGVRAPSAEPPPIAIPPAAAETETTTGDAANSPAWRCHPPYAPATVPVGCAILPAQPLHHCYRVAATNKAETNVSVKLHWQIGRESFALAARLDLLAAFMYEPLFDQLRTKEQLGYSVDCAVSNTVGMLGLDIHVTSSVATPVHIEGRARRFLSRFISTTLKRMPASKFAMTLEAAVANKLRDDTCLDDEVARLTAEVSACQYVWDRAQKEAAEMRAITQAELATWAKRALLGDLHTKMLSVYAHQGSCEDPDAMPTPPGSTPLNAAGVEPWKQGMAVYRTTEKSMPEVAGAPPPSDTTAEGAI